MLALKIIGIIVLICFLIGQIRVGVDFNCIDRKVTLSAKVCGLLIKLFPRDKKKNTSKKEKKPPKEKKPKKEKTNKPEKKKPKKAKKENRLCFNGEEILALIKKVLKGTGRFNRGFNVDRFLLHYTAAGYDPYDTAVTFGRVNFILSTLAPLCAKRFRCRDTDVWTDIDFNASLFSLDLGFAVVFRIGALFAMLNTILFGVLWIFIKNKCRFLWMKIFRKADYEYEMSRETLLTKLLSSAKEKKAAEEEPEEDAKENINENINS